MATEDPSILLRDLLVGATVSGIRFGSLQLLLAPVARAGEIFVNLNSAFHVFELRPANFPNIESEVPDQTEEEEMLSLFALRFVAVTHSEITDPDGHLVLTFANDAVLFVNGCNPGPEPWHVGLNAIEPSESVHILALSGASPIVFKPSRGR